MGIVKMMINRNFFYLITGQFVSQIGDKFHIIAISFWVLETNRNTWDRDRVIGNFSLNYEFNENLSLMGKVGTDHWNSLQTRRNAVGSNNNPDGMYRESVR